jgi:hypothetical protein
MRLSRRPIHVILRMASLGMTILALALPTRADAQWRRINVALMGFPQTVQLDSLAMWTNVQAPPAAVYWATRVALDSIPFPSTMADSAHGLVMHKGFITRRTLAGKSMSYWLRCGLGLTGENADSWRISLAYAVFIDSLPDRQSRLGVSVAAGANDVAGVSKGTVACATTGQLEQHITRRVMKVLIDNAGVWTR